jgi:alanyl-tRNA synthetase
VKSVFERSKCNFNVYFSHVAKTGDIKDFVITEESGIAKGIRRLIAVTGHEAAEAKRQAEVLKSRLDSLEIASGKEKDAGLKALTVVCLHLPSSNKCIC